MYSRKVATPKTIINCSNHGFKLKTYRTDNSSSWKYTISNYDWKFRYTIRTTYVGSPCYISKLALPPHNFTHPPPCCKWIRTFTKYGVMLALSGITLYQNIKKISELLPDLWWIDKRQYCTPCNPCHKNSPSFVEIAFICSRKLRYEGKNLPCDSRSAIRIFKFQSCYGVGCPGTYIRCLTTSLRNQRYVIYLS
jgi:hypothetical protein